MQAAKFDVRCPPWALPREEIPIQVKIDKTVADALSEVVFELPASLRLVDTINVVGLEECEGRMAVKAIGRARRSEYDYFGIVVATKEPFKDLKKEVPVKASFVMKDGSVDSRVAPVRVFRPRLEFADAPDVVVLDDAAPNGHSIPIRLKFSGFGDVTIRARCTVGGRVVSRGTSWLDEVLERFLRGPASCSGTELPGRPTAGADSAAAAPTAEELEEKLPPDGTTESMLDAGKIDVDAARMLHKLAGSDKERPIRHIHKAMPGVIVSILSDIRARTLGENLQLESKTVIVLPARRPLVSLAVEFRYADVLGNEYDPIQKTLQIDDRRRARGGMDLAIPLVVTADESRAYKNVGEMAIEARN